MFKKKQTEAKALTTVVVVVVVVAAVAAVASAVSAKGAAGTEELADTGVHERSSSSRCSSTET